MIEQVSEQQITLGPRSEFQILDFESGWGLSVFFPVNSFNTAPKKEYPQKTLKKWGEAGPSPVSELCTWKVYWYLISNDKLFEKESNSVQSFSLPLMIQFILLLFRKNCHAIISKSCVFRKEQMDGASLLGHCLSLNSIQAYWHEGELDGLYSVYLDPVL